MYSSQEGVADYSVCLANSSETWLYYSNFDTLFLVTWFISLVDEIYAD